MRYSNVLRIFTSCEKENNFKTYTHEVYYGL